MKIILGILIAIALGGCQTDAEANPPPKPPSAADEAKAKPLRPPSAADEAKAKAAVKRILKDPSSAVFEGLFTHPGAVCGFVNSKNSYGGYSGRAPFGYIIERDVAYVLEPGNMTGHVTVIQYCVR